MSTNHPLRLPEIRLPRMPEVPMTKLPEIRIPDRAKLTSHHSEILSQKDITPSDVRDRPASSLGFESPKNSRNESKRASSSLETSYGSPKNTRISPLDPPRKRSSSSSWIGPTSSISSSSSSSSLSSTYNPSASTPSLPLHPSLVESPKRTSSLSSLFPSPLSSVSSLLEEQAESSMQSIPAIPSFSQKIPLKREKSDSEKMGDGKSDGPRPKSPLVDKKQKRKSPLSKTKEKLNRSDTPVKPIKLEQETLHKSADDIEKRDEETKEKIKEQTREETKEERKENGKDPTVETEKEEKFETAGMFKSKSTWIMPTAAPTETPFQRCMKNLNIRVFVSTWNMQGKPPPASGLELLITPHTHDIYAIGTEECETTIQRALLSPPKQKWEDKLSSMLGSEYIMLPTATLGAVHLAVFVHASLIPIISDIRTGSIPTGLGNVVANKGGVAVTFYVGTSSFAFVTAHFTAHHNKVEQRNADFHRINNMLSLSSPNQPAPLSLPLPSSSSPSFPSLPRSSSSAPSSSSSPSTPSSTPPAQRKKEKRSSRENSTSNIEEMPQQTTENKEPPKTQDTQDPKTQDTQETKTKTQDTQETKPHEAHEPKTHESPESQETKTQDTMTQDTKIQDTQEPQTQDTQEPQETKQQETKTPDKQEKKSRRRSSLIKKSSTLTEDTQNATTQGPSAMTQSQTQLPRMPQAGASIMERFDRVFWSGDLNYRINGNKKIVEETIKQNLVEVLVANDQLTIERKKGSVFQGFLEGPLNFIPTYKYDSGSDTFDTSAKARVPSWTDRILFKTSEHIVLHEYSSCAGLKYTDHRPVYASFEVVFDPPDLSGGNQVGSGGGAAGSKVCTIL